MSTWKGLKPVLLTEVLTIRTDLCTVCIGGDRMGFKYFYPSVLLPRSSHQSRYLLTRSSHQPMQVQWNPSNADTLGPESNHQSRYLLIIDKIYCYSTGVYKTLKMVKGCRIDTGLCEKASSKVSSKNAWNKVSYERHRAKRAKVKRSIGLDRQSSRWTIGETIGLGKHRAIHTRG